MSEKFTKGDTYGPNECGIWQSGISTGGWGNRIEVYGNSEAHARKLRDRVLDALTSSSVEESESFPINVAWGSFNADGSWQSNYEVDVSRSRQRQENIEGGHLCAGCNHKPSHCVCLKEGV